MKTFKQFFKTLIATVYPNKCICCGEIIDEDALICHDCNFKIERIDPNNICLKCGLEKENCVCKYNIFRFNSLVCVFNNTGLAKKAYYAYKFGKRQHYVNFFAKEISDYVAKCYGEINFDFICAVPSYRKYGYDHSGYLAREVSKNLGVPFMDGLLTCIKKSKKQHSSTINERLNNVDGKYRANYRVDNKKILLIDDIKTTGATIDECARVLLFAGADSVFCATALGTSMSKK